MVLKYDGAGIKDGTIEVGDLICGLQGLADISRVLSEIHDPQHKAILKVESFSKGSFEIVLDFIEKHPVLFNGVSSIFVVVITAIISAIITTKKQLNDINMGDIVTTQKLVIDLLEKILSDPKKTKRLSEGFYQIAKPLKEGNIDNVTLNDKKVKATIAAKDKEYFYNEDLAERVHRTIELNGYIRNLDKKTHNGKFVDTDNKTYSFTLVMDNPEDCHVYYIEDNLNIKGIATINKDTKDIEKIEIEKIETNA